MKTKFHLLLLSLLLVAISSHSQRIQQRLGRGVVAVANGSSVTVTWRRLAQEAENATYNIYVNGNKINSTPLRNTNYKTTTSTIPLGSKVSVSIIQNGIESEKSEPFEFKGRDLRNMFMDINFENGGSPLKSADFNTAYVWPVDLNGNGEMDYVVNRKSNTNSLDCYVEGYLSSGEHLWTVNLGPNELSCSGQDDMITACDMDCDGYADVVIQSSDGTQFWNPSTKSFGLYVNGKTTGDTDGDGIINYETQNSKNAPRYISVIDGLTGKEKSSVEQSYNSHYNRTNRASLMGDEYNKHVGHMGVFYFDGIHPAVVMEWHIRGSGGDHHYYNGGWAYDFSSGKAGKLIELFNEPSNAPAFHQIRIGDPDGDGCDEMIVGGYTMDNSGKVLFNTGIAHGDRFRTSDIDPERPGLETFAIQQYAGDMLGQVLYDASNGEFIKKWYMPATGDVGRGECIDIDKNHLGWEMWSTMDSKVYDAQGNLITEYGNQYPCEGIWWDDELDREVVQTSDSHYNVYVQDFFKGREIEIAKMSGYRYVTVYAKRAAFWGDIIGDWREELILLHKENGVIVGICGFTTDYTTPIDDIYCLLQDPHYLGDCTTKGYYQSPNPGFYLGYDMPRPQLPPVMVTDLIARPDGTFTDYSRSSSTTFSDGKSLLLDLSYGNNTFNVVSSLNPSKVYAMPVKGQTITIAGSGDLSGKMDLWKSQQGKLEVNIPLNYTGTTYISEGILSSSNTIKGDVDLRARGTLSGNVTVEGKLTTEGALNYEGCRLMPGSESSNGLISLKKGLSIYDGRLFAEMNISNDQSSDLIHIDGDLSIIETGSLIFSIVSKESKLQPNEFKLIEYTGTFKGSIDKISVRGLLGLSYNIIEKANAIWLVINEQRDASTGVKWTGSESGIWNYQDKNFSIAEKATEFVANDEITIDDSAIQTSITLDDLFPISNIEFNNNTKTITLKGTGGFTGSGGLTKNGNGTLTINTTNSTYTGKTIINGGTVSVSELADGGLPSSLGSSSASNGNFQIGKATLLVNNSNTATNRTLTLNDTATVQINSGTVSFKGIVNGDGRFVKKGNGQVNFTYGGTNTFKGGIQLVAGSIAQGSWNSTFGPAGSPIDVIGNSTIVVFNNNSTGAVPNLNNAIDISKGKTLNIQGGQRCRISGSFKGDGTVKFSFPYVRGDFTSNMSNFNGTLEASSGQFRLISAMNLSNGKFVLGSGVYAYGVNSGGGNETNYTHKIGELSSSATDCTLSTSVWNVGYLGTNSTYAGILNGNATLNKYGEGALTLTGQSNCPINVYEGSVLLNNSTNTTSGSVRANEGGTVRGTGKTSSIIIASGGILAAGKESTVATGTLSVIGNLTVQNGGIIELRGRGNTMIDNFNISGKTSLTNPIFRMTRLAGEWMEDTDYKFFTGSGTITLTGSPTFEPSIPKAGYKWDYSELASNGIIKIVVDPDAVNIEEVKSNPQQYMIYDTSGRRVHNITGHGTYIVNGKVIIQ